MKVIRQTLVVALIAACSAFVGGAAERSRSTAHKVEAPSEQTSAPREAGVQALAPKDEPRMDVAKVAKAVVTPAQEGLRPEPPAAPQIIVVTVPPPAPELDSLRKSLTAADDEIERARPDRDLLERLNAHLEGIRGDMSARDARTEAEAAAAREAVGRRQQAIDALFDAERRLATGDSQVVDTLDGAVPALPFPAQDAARNARTAVESEDLYRARWWIRLAIVQAQATFLRN